MTALQLELVIDPAQPAQRTIADRLQQQLQPAEGLRVVLWQDWSPGVCRSPGSGGSEAVCVLLAAARWQQGQQQPQTLPGAVLVLSELVGGSAREIGSGTALTAPQWGEPASRFVLCTPSASRGTTELCSLVQFAVPSLARWRRHQQRCLLAAADYLLWWLRLCEQRQVLLPIAPSGRNLPLQPPPSVHLRQQLAASGRWALSGARRRMNHWLERDGQPWQVGIGQLDPAGRRWQLVHQLTPSGTDWFADPFLVADGDCTWLFCERWDDAAAKGVIELFAVNEGAIEACGPVMREPFHLSFPRVVQHDGAWFATVESGRNGDVRLYRAEAFPYRWRLERQLLIGQAWIDPILIPTSEGWWLLVNSHNCPALPGSTAAELHLFHSPDLLHGQFTPHTDSPMLVDSTCGRNGGLLHIDGELVRVTQRTGIDNEYGEGVQLRRIERIDQGRYTEIPMEPAWLQQLPQQLRASHLHTLNNAGRWLALDYRPRGVSAGRRRNR